MSTFQLLCDSCVSDYLSWKTWGDTTWGSVCVCWGVCVEGGSAASWGDHRCLSSTERLLKRRTRTLLTLCAYLHHWWTCLMDRCLMDASLGHLTNQTRDKGRRVPPAIQLYKRLWTKLSSLFYEDSCMGFVQHISGHHEVFLYLLNMKAVYESICSEGTFSHCFWRTFPWRTY